MFLIAVATTVADTKVTIPLGDILALGLGFIQNFAPWAVAGALSFIPVALRPVANMFRVDQLLTNALNFAVKQAIDKTKDQNFTVDVQNQMVADALRYVMTHGPSALIKWAGGEVMVREKLEARLGAFLKDLLSNPKK